jgi:hypothetical protein
MEKVEQPNDIHEQNMRYFQFDLFFRSRPKCPEHDLEPPDAIMLIFNAARRADKGSTTAPCKIAVFVGGGWCQAPVIFSLRATDGRFARLSLR